jgi:pimeloyl-ACP methyl ester carboxylesterase
MSGPVILADHAGIPFTHGKPKVNGVEIHYAIGGAGEPVFLLHGVPKTMSYWRHVAPLLTPHYTVVAVDNRGFGGSQRPLNGYDTATMADDVAELANWLGFDRFRVAGEDWGAAIAYAVAAFHRHRVRQLVFQETLLPGLPTGERDPSLAPDDGRTGWHFSFFTLPNLPELLLTGRERPFWTYFARRQMWDPSAERVGAAAVNLTDVGDSGHRQYLRGPTASFRTLPRAGVKRTRMRSAAEGPPMP